MPFYACNHCGAQVEAKNPPFVCKSCAKKNPGFTKVETPPPPPPPSTGRLVGSFPAVPVPGSLPMRNGLVLDAAGQRIYACLQSRLVALSAGDGPPTCLWEYVTGGHIPGPPVLGPDGNVRVHSSDGFLHFVAPNGQRPCDPAAVGEPLSWAVPLVDERNTTWICGSQGGLRQVDAAGRKADRPFLRTRERFDGPGLIHRDVLYVAGSNHCLYAIPLDEPRGTNRWDHLAGQGKVTFTVNAALTLAPGPLLLAVTRDDQLFAFRLDGTLQWNVALPGRVNGSPVVDGEAIYLGLSHLQRGAPGRGSLIRLDAGTRKVQWKYDTDAPVESTPVLGSEGTIHFGDNAGTLHAVDAAGQRLWTQALGCGVRSPGTFVAPQRLVFGVDDGRLAFVRCDAPGPKRPPS